MIIEKGKWLIQFWEEYSQFFDKCNWYTFTFAKLEFENDSHMGAYEATIVLLGFGFRWRWEHTETEFKREILRRVDEFENDVREE